MTPRERADKIANGQLTEWTRRRGDDFIVRHGLLARLIEAAITEAIAATREEDARIADHYAQSMIGLPGGASPHNAALNIAALIRKAPPTTGGTE